MKTSNRTTSTLTLSVCLALASFSDAWSQGESIAHTPKSNDASVTSENSAYSVFLLIKATPGWLALTPEERFAWLDETIQPILLKYPEVSMRFWDVEHFSAETSDVVLFETQRLDRYMSLIEAMRETRFRDDYFLVQSILPGIENANADAYDRDAY